MSTVIEKQERENIRLGDDTGDDKGENDVGMKTSQMLLDLIEIILNDSKVKPPVKKFMKQIKNEVYNKDPVVLALLYDSLCPLSELYKSSLLDGLRLEWDYLVCDSDDCIKFLKRFKEEADSEPSKESIDQILQFFEKKTDEINPLDIIGLVTDINLTKYYDILMQIHDFIEPGELIETEVEK